MIYWHYTNGRHIIKIMADGVLNPADDGSGASPLVWLSCNPVWEYGAARYEKSPASGGRLVVLTASQMDVKLGGIFRIAVDTDRFALHKWSEDLIERAGISERVVGMHMAGAYLVDSDLTQWAGSLKPITCEFWRGADYWRGGEWITLGDDDVGALVERLWRTGTARIKAADTLIAVRCRLSLAGLFMESSSRKYRAAIRQAVEPATEWIESRTSGPSDKDEKLAAIFDIDETCLSNLPSMNRGAIQPVLDLYSLAKSKGVALFFITDRRESDRCDTASVLSAAGYSDWTDLHMRPKGNADSTEVMKSGLRQSIERMGYKIILNIGDQDGDLAGGYSERAYKLPNPWE